MSRGPALLAAVASLVLGATNAIAHPLQGIVITRILQPGRGPFALRPRQVEFVAFAADVAAFVVGILLVFALGLALALYGTDRSDLPIVLGAVAVGAFVGYLLGIVPAAVLWGVGDYLDQLRGIGFLHLLAWWVSRPILFPIVVAGGLAIGWWATGE